MAELGGMWHVFFARGFAQGCEGRRSRVGGACPTALQRRYGRNGAAAPLPACCLTSRSSILQAPLRGVGCDGTRDLWAWAREEGI